MDLFARPAPSSGGRLLSQLDALRGVAVLAVFAQHLGDRFMPFVEERTTSSAPAWLVPWLLTVLHHAWWGVDLFFVLSGFSLGLGYARAFGAGRASPSTGTFLWRRAARILPAYFAALALILAVRPHVVHLPGFWPSIGAHLALLQGYVLPGGIVLIGATWSLTTEAHFYLLLPWIAKPLLGRDAASRLRPWLFGAALVLGAWLVRASLHALVLEPNVHTALLEATQRRWIISRLDQFVLGAMAAGVYEGLMRSPKMLERARAFAPFGLGLALFSLPFAFRLEGEFYLSPGGSWPYALMSLSTALLVLSASLCKGHAQKLVAPWPLCALGVVSYGFFLNHQLALGLVGAWLGPEKGSWWSLFTNALLALGLSIVMGAVSWIAIERPVLRWSATPRASSASSAKEA